MNIKEASTKKKELESMIQNLLNDFSLNTGLTVEDIRMEKFYRYGCGESYIVIIDAGIP